MKLIGKVLGLPHDKEAYDVQITKRELETLDLILTMYTPFLSMNKVLLMDDSHSTVKHRLKTLRAGINKIKREIKK